MPGAGAPCNGNAACTPIGHPRLAGFTEDKRWLQHWGWLQPFSKLESIRFQVGWPGVLEGDGRLAGNGAAGGSSGPWAAGSGRPPTQHCHEPAALLPPCKPALLPAPSCAGFGADATRTLHELLDQPSTLPCLALPPLSRAWD